MPSLPFPPEIVRLILDKLPTSQDVSSFSRACKQTSYYGTPVLYRSVTIIVKGARTRVRAIQLVKDLAGNAVNLSFIRELHVSGYWQNEEEHHKRGRRKGRDVTESERDFGVLICNIIPTMKNLTSFKWRIVAYLPPCLGEYLLRNEHIQKFEAFVDPQIERLDVGLKHNGLNTTSYPASILPIGLHSLTSLHILQLGTFRDCACYGDIIQASPQLRSLWVDVSPTFEKLLASVNPQYADVLSLLLRQQMHPYRDMPAFENRVKLLKLSDLRLSRLHVTMAGVLALQDCVDLNYLESIVLNYCFHKELMPFLTQRIPNLMSFRDDEESELHYIEEFLRYNAAAMENTEHHITPVTSHKKGLEKLWLSCAMSSDYDIGKLSPYFRQAGVSLKTMCLDLNWGEFDNWEEVLSGCSKLEELAAWIECDGDQWENMAKAISTHSRLQNLCIFNTDSKGEPLSHRIKSRLYSCVKSNRLGHEYLHRNFNEDGGEIGRSQRCFQASKEMTAAGVGDLQHVAIRHDIYGEVALTVWKILVDYETSAVRMVDIGLDEVSGTTMFRDVLRIDYFYS